MTSSSDAVPDGLVAVAARFLVGSGPEAWRGLLAQHVADPSGHCAGCLSQTQGSPVWPCTLRVIAETARRIAATGRPAG